MEQRPATSPEQVPHFDTAALRAHYLVPDLFKADQVKLVYTHHDRIVLGGLTPVSRPLTLAAPAELRAETFFAGREAGLVNVGGPGVVAVGPDERRLDRGDCLYIGRGAPDPVFASQEPGEPARFYVFSAPAHATHPTSLATAAQAAARELGDQSTSNRRVIRQYIHQGAIQSCQVVMGVTTLEPGSMWNTMPAHTH
ncbi:MAG: 5-dehydro-4-deoxy-D-glucuronate isomerase, partial [Bifidobacteriaceae bacterium]|nr:5-dehydro-4-deoxy-D-glucuronate isomerase [Bifidobacteriaceae bacterium]